ncbi:MAG: CDP-diacylglycerol--glycerol-3-phosphate 3-phosphatidyltransferase [Vicinamibacteria bacterium]
MNLPNALTALRIFLVPWLVVLLLTRTDWGWLLGIIVFTIAVITDFLDGWIARRRNQLTSLGALLDPLADKLLVSAAFISLIELEMAPAWIVAVIIGREFAVTWLRSEALGRGIVISASGMGKAKTVSQIVSIYVMLLGLRVPHFRVLVPVALFVALALTLYSGFDYFRHYARGMSKV